MSDWIDELRIRRDSALKGSELAGRVPQSDEELTKAKSPAFWAELMDYLEKDINRLNEKFADDDRYQAHFTELTHNAFEISNCVRPYKTIQGRLNENHLLADLEIWTSVNRETSAEKGRKTIQFGLTANAMSTHSTWRQSTTSRPAFPRRCCKSYWEYKFEGAPSDGSWHMAEPRAGVRALFRRRQGIRVRSLRGDC